MVQRILTIFFVCFAVMAHTARSQMKEELKNFLWEREFQELLSSYGEENVSLHDAGERLRRLEARPYLEKEGMRVQVFAGTSRDNALNMAQNIRSLNIDSVYVLESTGLFKVQVGNFSERIEAEKMLDRLRYSGIENAWIVQDTIHVKKETDALSGQADVQIPPPAGIPFRYSIQVFVTGDRGKAEQIRAELDEKFNETVWTAPQGEFWKVFIGRYSDEQTARFKLEEVRRGGYPDAWLTQISE